VKNSITELVEFDKYDIDINGIVTKKTNGKKLRYYKNNAGYKSISVYDNYGKKRGIRLCRALVSTYHGPPPTPKHTVDHIDRDQNNDTVDNLRWLCQRGQNNNQNRSEIKKDAFIIEHNGVGKTIKDWVYHLKDQKNSFGRDYTATMIFHYAQRKLFGFSYKNYPDFPEEVWKKITGSKTNKGLWEISNMNRVRYVTKFAHNVLEGDSLGLTSGGYPRISLGDCHVLAFKTFFPEEWANKEVGWMVLHEDDDKLDFRPHKLRLGTASQNSRDAYDNGKHNGKQSERVKCASYIVGVLEKEHLSQSDAVRYLKTLGFEKASVGNICQALVDFSNGKTVIRYGRTWKTC